MKIKKTSDKNRTVSFDVTVPKKDIQKRYEQALKKLSESAKVEGFRPGKAPSKMAEKTLGKERIYDQLIQDLLPDVYKKILEQEDIKPVVSPKVDLKDAKEEKDWNLTMTFALQPKVKVPDYKKIVEEAKKEAKKDDIWVPGKGDPKKMDAEKVKKKEEYINTLLTKIIEKTDIEISDIIIEQEVNQRLSRLMDDIKKIGLTIDAYLESRNTTKEQLKEDFVKDIMNTYKLEYALNEIGDKEDITVGEDELKKMIGEVPEGKQREEAMKNAYVYSTMLRKQKILDYLGDL